MTTRLLITIFSVALASIMAQGQPAPTIFDELYRNEIIDVELETDLSRLLDNRNKDEYQHAILTFTNKTGQVEKHDLKIKPRGKFRRSVCNFPPIKLNFSKDRLMARGYTAEYDKLKLVTHCLEDKGVSKDNVAREYLAYQLYQQLTEKSYRTQLMKITYVDSKDRVSRIKRHGFVLEDTDEMAHRAGGKECEECRGLPASEYISADENLMAVFQYMIGNADYDLDMMRNVKMVRSYLNNAVVPVPYDFDFAGLVDPSYAIPNADYGLVSVKQRVFLGHKVNYKQLETTLVHIEDRRSELERTVKDCPLLSRSERQEVLRYLNTFFAELDAILQGMPEPQPLRLQALPKEAGKATPQMGKKK